MIQLALALYVLTVVAYAAVVWASYAGGLTLRTSAGVLLLVTGLAYVLAAVLTAGRHNPDIDNLLYTAQLVRSRVFVYDAVSPAVFLSFHPYLPFEMFIAAGAEGIHHLTHLPFSIGLKLPAIAAVLATALLVRRSLFRTSGARTADAASLAFVLNPMMIAVTAYHGQFDAIPTFFAFGAWFALQHRKGEVDELASAALLGLGILSKTWPVLLLAPLAAAVPGSPARKLRYAAIALSIPLIASVSYALALDGSISKVFNEVRGYRGLPGFFGYTVILLRLPGSTGQTNARLLDWALNEGRVVLVLAVLCATTIVLLRRFGTAHGSLTVLLTFFVFNPGSIQHYQVWLLPFAAVVKDRLALFLFTGLVTASMLIHPFYSHDWGLSSVAIGRSWFVGGVAWLFTVVWLARCLLRGWPLQDRAAEGEATPA